MLKILTAALLLVILGACTAGNSNGEKVMNNEVALNDSVPAIDLVEYSRLDTALFALG
jgi:hypothetical protein